MLSNAIAAPRGGAARDRIFVQIRYLLATLPNSAKWSDIRGQLDSRGPDIVPAMTVATATTTIVTSFFVFFVDD